MKTFKTANELIEEAKNLLSKVNDNTIGKDWSNWSSETVNGMEAYSNELISGIKKNVKGVGDNLQGLAKVIHKLEDIVSDKVVHNDEFRKLIDTFNNIYKDKKGALSDYIPDIGKYIGISDNTANNKILYSDESEEKHAEPKLVETYRGYMIVESSPTRFLVASVDENGNRKFLKAFKTIGWCHRHINSLTK